MQIIRSLNWSRGCSAANSRRLSSHRGASWCENIHFCECKARGTDEITHSWYKKHTAVHFLCQIIGLNELKTIATAEFSLSACHPNWISSLMINMTLFYCIFILLEEKIIELFPPLRHFRKGHAHRHPLNWFKCFFVSRGSCHCTVVSSEANITQLLLQLV